jgi:hypothetical protein
MWQRQPHSDPGVTMLGLTPLLSAAPEGQASSSIALLARRAGPARIPKW